ncbi:3-hydroxyacyl-CoA dehydrogenase family protein [Geobacter hydrogenophilus]|uniref:3-hydroxybutyryl-CoA dehydrogenase n=1 Tax=Geobacter hydrogenophilus TaxID=40983 RepID=A0A9W6FZT2_9BACT|nr:3-hydroxyacyl-CoA dehydrogenase family protein [Geobacter hydrogenophilus]MBT0893517.1 3-hydroxyacyl-CoA dehydrogenase family protein [Geobacter hydrogenophilus]GLI37788.1 3-hydroxybutyryl-CoA dehydrogenase [Geobacter hydrogenophilus]
MKLDDIKTVGMAGAGSMGAGIAQVAAMAGLQVKVVDVSEDVWGRAKKTIVKSLERIVKKGAMTEAEMEETLGRISFSTDVASLAGVPFIFEAVFEDITVKKELFAKLDAVCGDDTIYATNTSSIAITEMAALVKNPANFVGMHFFNPVPMMKLVEVIPALQTAEATKNLTLEMAKKIGKTAITCKDTPGFVVNRLFVPYIIDAVRLLEEGVASAEDIDTAMKLGCNMPMGPLEFQDFAGVDIGYHVTNIFHDYMKQERFAAPGLLRNMIKAGYLGRKSGRGFYDYSEQ